MYQSPTQPGQWSQNAPPSTSQPNQQGQQHPQQPPQQQGPPQAWSPQPPNGQNQYQPPRPNQQSIGPPPTHAPTQGPVMATLQPSHPDQYRALPSLPPPQQMYAPQYPAPQMGYPQAQPAPRQRTAIACRYCRRRKIRCSGFDQSEDGRCTNCQRFSQECVFTPVSAQTQAFVPAHTVWRGQNPPPNTQLYGAYGQPLPAGGRDAYPPPQQQPGQYGPPPQGYQHSQPMYAQPPQQGAQAAPMQTPNSGDAGRKRANDEPHTPTLPPPNPASQMPHRGSDGQYTYSDQSADKDNVEKAEWIRRNPTKSVGVQVDLLTDAKEQAS